MKYAFDTNIFIDGFRDDDAQSEVFVFLNRALPFVYLSAVVMQELAAGARTADAVRALQRGIFEPFVGFSRPSLHGRGGSRSTKSPRSSMTR